MFVAMNRFQVQPGKGEDFERIWRERESYLEGVPGFVQFALLRGAPGAHGADNAGEYVSHSTWESRASFDAWTQSDSFRRGHAQGSLAGIFAGPPVVSLYEAVIVEVPAPTALT